MSTASKLNDDSDNSFGSDYIPTIVLHRSTIVNDAPLLIRSPFEPPRPPPMRIKAQMSSAFTPAHINELIKNPLCCMCSSKNVNWFMSNCGHPLCFGSICGNFENNACPRCGVNGELVHRSDIDPVYTALKKRAMRETLAELQGEVENAAKVDDIGIVASNPPQ